jgi:outer membrane murein-binding lipoprotein Lpp
MNLLERARSKSPYLAGSSAERLIDELADEIKRLTAEVQEWKERWAAERRDHETTIRHFDMLMNEGPI